ncbi:MAG: hypothetical protein KDK07_13990 [Bauldia sp.]|nr:hypothetical protein [Bauldia sp.]
MLRFALTALSLAGLAGIALAATDAELKQQIIGVWGQDANCAAGALTFIADGTFKIDRTGAESRTGTWDIVDGILSGADSDGGKQPDVKVRIDGDTLYVGAPDGSGEESMSRCPD